MTLLEEIRDASEEALAKIASDPNRIRELDDDDLTAVALQVKTARPMMENALISFCNGDVDRANAALKTVAEFSQAKLVKLVRRGHAAMRAPHRNPSINQLAALVYDLQVGCGAITVEQERRQAVKARAMN